MTQYVAKCGKMEQKDVVKIVDVRVRLRGKIKDKFLALKDALGVTNNTEVVRIIIKAIKVKDAKEILQHD